MGEKLRKVTDVTALGVSSATGTLEWRAELARPALVARFAPGLHWSQDLQKIEQTKIVQIVPLAWGVGRICNWGGNLPSPKCEQNQLIAATNMLGTGMPKQYENLKGYMSFINNMGTAVLHQVTITALPGTQIVLHKSLYTCHSAVCAHATLLSVQIAEWYVHNDLWSKTVRSQVLSHLTQPPTVLSLFSRGLWS